MEQQQKNLNRAQLKRYLPYARLMNRVSGDPFFRPVALVLVLVVVGTSGYMIIEGWSILDALYMTAITVTTIGYGEVQSLSQTGRVFTLGLIITGVIAASYAVKSTIEIFTSKEFLERLQYRRRRKALNHISNHTIICGYGRMGRSLATELQARGTTLVIIDTDGEAIEECRQAGILAVPGNASDEDVLREAGLERANALVTTTPSDAENVFVALTARSTRPDLQIIARCNAESSIPKLEKAGANTVISPYAIAGRRIAHLLTHPNVTSFLDGVLEFGGQQMRLQEFIIGQNSALAGQTLQEARLNAVVLAVDHPGETIYTHPQADTKLLPGTAIIAMGIDQELNKLAQQVKG